LRITGGLVKDKKKDGMALHMLEKLHVMIIFGTRPEAIKLAPVIAELKKRPDKFRAIVCVTAQHRQMLDQALEIFGIKPDIDLNIMQPGQTLSELTARSIAALDSVLADIKPDWALVQGDTTTTMAASLACFYRGVRVGHVEAGLRTDNKLSPFPEEINRRLTSVIADFHFAPTERAHRALLNEGISDSLIAVTGNTAIDALLWMEAQIKARPPEIDLELKHAIEGKRIILVTGHRRESFGAAFENICMAIKDLVMNYGDICVVYPVHLNPNVREPVNRILGNLERVHLIEPLAYAPFVWFMDKSYLILTDSGGIQEEAPSLGKPTLVMREVTERPEGIEAGCNKLVGAGRNSVFENVSQLLQDDDKYVEMARVKNPYGDGRAAERIVNILLKKKAD
jgi:UDP-N-acetylglucosamine 2-epimerase (non-hydrolysing)